MVNINSWNAIRWSSMEKNVLCLQLKIYKAAANLELEKLYKFQKLLISSKAAKYLSVRKVTEKNSGKIPLKVYSIIIKTPSIKFALAEQLILNEKYLDFKKISTEYLDKKQNPLKIFTIEDQAKQMLTYLALSAQWEAFFEASNYGFRSNKSVDNVLESIFVNMSKKSKWVLNIKISKYLDQINYQYLLDKCKTIPEIQEQIRSWLKIGILNKNDNTFPKLDILQSKIITPLLINILLNGIRKQLNIYLNSLKNYQVNNKQDFTYIDYANDFVFMHSNKKVIEDWIPIIQNFLFFRKNVSE